MKYKVVQKTRHLIEQEKGSVSIQGEYIYTVYANSKEEARRIIEEDLEDSLIEFSIETVSVEEVKEGD